jgi:hypothetical protein
LPGGLVDERKLTHSELEAGEVFFWKFSRGGGDQGMDNEQGGERQGKPEDLTESRRSGHDDAELKTYC